MKVAREIKRFREKMGWTQEAFALELGVSPRTVNRWETGKFVPMKVFVEKLRLLGCLLDDQKGGEV